MKKLLILDFDGTIADTKMSIITTIQETLKTLGTKQIDVNEIQKRIGLPLKDTFVELTELQGEKIEEAIKIYRSKYNDICYDTVTLFPNVKETLEYCFDNGIKIAVASSKGKESLGNLLEHLELKQYISLIVGEQDVENKKPAPDMVNLILDKLEFSASETLVVGDTIFDIEMGQRAKTDTCGVNYGNHSVEQLQKQGADNIISDFIELKEILL